jgi:putative component of membrane protein insertase Oxa1/YidC/SpoIIIJ protein YidD
MRWLLILSIRVYRLIPSRFKKRRCLYRETCSLFVMRATMEGGLLIGCRALRQRFERCRPPYSVCYDNPSRDWKVMLADGSEATSAEMADFIIEPYQAALTSVEAKTHAMSV